MRRLTLSPSNFVQLPTSKMYGRYSLEPRKRSKVLEIEPHVFSSRWKGCPESGYEELGGLLVLGGIWLQGTPSMCSIEVIGHWIS